MHLKMKSQFYFFLPPFLVFGPASPATLPPACSFFFSFPHRLFCYLGRPMPKPKRGAAVAFPICGWHAGPASQRHRLPLVADPDSSSTFLPADAEYRDRTLRVCVYPMPRALLSAPINTAAPPFPSEPPGQFVVTEASSSRSCGTFHLSILCSVIAHLTSPWPCSSSPSARMSRTPLAVRPCLWYSSWWVPLVLCFRLVPVPWRIVP